MRWLALSLVLSFAASAQSVLLVPQDAKARPFAEELQEVFAAQNVKVKMAGATSPAVACLKDKAKRNACLGDLEKKAKVNGVVVMGVVAKGPRGNATFELLVNGAVTHKENAKGQKGKLKATMTQAVAALVKALPAEEAVVEKPPEKPVEPVAAKDPEPVKDAPVAEPLVPKKSAIEEELGIKMPKERPVKRRKRANVPAWIAAGVGVVAAGTAITFAALGAAGNGQLQTAPNGVSSLSGSEALALRDASNMNFTVALTTGIIAGAAGGTAGLLWGLE